MKWAWILCCNNHPIQAYTHCVNANADCAKHNQTEAERAAREVKAGFLKARNYYSVTKVPVQ